ncbi:MAG: HD domain-containing protein [Deltaproteobacteria bacterium]|nr:HD domain-containing protein [Deltaproteobacteria bacterium]
MRLHELIDADPRLSLVLARAPDPSDPSHDRTHLFRVAVWTLRLAPPSVDRAEAIAAALLHDLVVIEKSSPDRSLASERSASAARDLLREAGFAEAAIERISEAIRTCSFSRGESPTSELGRALADADALDALGAIGILRAATTGARMGSRYYDPKDPLAKARELDDRRQTLDHFEKKLYELPARMTSAQARAEAEARVARMRRFVAELLDEIDDGDRLVTTSDDRDSGT